MNAEKFRAENRLKCLKAGEFKPYLSHSKSYKNQGPEKMKLFLPKSLVRRFVYLWIRPCETCI
jgi:hypothetical protein